MPYDEALAARVRDRIPTAEERKMFGGVAFMHEGHMLCGVLRDRLMVRVGPEQHPTLLEEPHAAIMDFTGRPSRNMLYVEPDGLTTDDDLDTWIGRARTFVSSLPPKHEKLTPPKAPRKKTTAKKATARRATARRATARKAAPRRSRANTAVDETPAAFAGFPKGTLTFLRGLDRNNHKEWFDSHRRDYDAFYVAPARAFVDALGPRIQSFAPTVSYAPKINGSIFRIQRDTRFSQDKTPYKNHLDFWFWDGARRGWDTPGFYLRITPKKIMLGAGMHKLAGEQRDAFRAAVVDDASGKTLTRVVNKIEKGGIYAFGEPTRKKVPRGFDPDHPRARFLLRDGFSAGLEGELPAELHDAAFADWCTAHFRKLAPIHGWLRDVLGA